MYIIVNCLYGICTCMRWWWLMVCEIVYPLLMIKVCDSTVHKYIYVLSGTKTLCPVSQSWGAFLFAGNWAWLYEFDYKTHSIHQPNVGQEWTKPLKQLPFLVTKKTLPATRSLVKSCFKVVMLPRCLGVTNCCFEDSWILLLLVHCWSVLGIGISSRDTIWWTTVNHYSSQKWPKAADRADPLGSNIAVGWKIHHLSRCISYSRWGFSSQLCLFTGG